MAKELINLETTEKIGLLETIQIGIAHLTKNFLTFIKMLWAPLAVGASCALFFLALSFLTFGALFFTTKNLPLAFVIGVLFVVLTLCLICYTVWKFLLGLVAVPYFARDLYEGREAKEMPVYFEYAAKNSKEYLKFWLWMSLIGIMYIAGLALLFGFEKIIPLLGLIIALIPLMIIPFCLSFALEFWIFQDKGDPLDAIKNSFAICFKKFGDVFIYNIAINALVTLVLNLLFVPLTILINILIPNEGILFDNMGNLDTQTLIHLTVCIFVQVFIAHAFAYVLSFIKTRAYFELIKNK